MRTKICKKCGEEKDLNDFYKHVGMKDGTLSYCKTCKRLYAKSELQTEHKKEYRDKYPWKRTLEYIKQRCNNPNKDVYEYYGGRGIQCQITSEELKEIWFRDRAYLMERPTIDRIDNDGNYIFKNCQYLEPTEHAKKRKIDYLTRRINNV